MVAAQCAGDGLPQLRNARPGACSGAGSGPSVLGGLDNVRGRVEVGVAVTKRDHVGQGGGNRHQRVRERDILVDHAIGQRMDQGLVMSLLFIDHQ